MFWGIVGLVSPDSATLHPGYLLDTFWLRYTRHDRRAEALAALGLADPIDDPEIKRRYRELAMKHHPDRGGEMEKLQAINAAMGLLETLRGQ